MDNMADDPSIENYLEAGTGGSESRYTVLRCYHCAAGDGR